MLLAITWLFIIFWGDRPVVVDGFTTVTACIEARDKAVIAVRATRFGGREFADKTVTECTRR